MAVLSRSIGDDIMWVPACTAGIYEKKNIHRVIPHRGLDSVPNYSDKPTQHSLLLTFSLFRRAFTGEFFIEEIRQITMVFSESTTPANISFFFGYSSGKPPRKGIPLRSLAGSLSNMIIRNYQFHTVHYLMLMM